jgi:hypothetical protein
MRWKRRFTHEYSTPGRRKKNLKKIDAAGHLEAGREKKKPAVPLKCSLPQHAFWLIIGIA